MTTRTYRSFSSEMMKIASGVKDADIQALIAARKGEEYLAGGRLTTNSKIDDHLPPSQEKQASFPSMAALQLGAATSPLDKTKNKKPGSYQEGRDWAVTGLKGATGGASAVGLYRGLKGRQTMTARHLRLGATLGAAAALGDRAYRHSNDKEKAAEVNPTPGASFGSPAKALADGQQTGRFQAQRIHTPKPLATAGTLNKLHLPRV